MTNVLKISHLNMIDYNCGNNFHDVAIIKYYYYYFQIIFELNYIKKEENTLQISWIYWYTKLCK